MSDYSLSRRKALFSKEYPVYFYAGFWSRLMAFLIDLMMIGALTSMLIRTPLRMLFVSLEDKRVLLHILELTVYLSYFILLTKLTGGQTLGKMIVGIRVIHIGREPLSWNTVIIREGFGRIALKVVPLLYLPMLFNQRKQQFIDILCDTSVISEKMEQVALEAAKWKLAEENKGEDETGCRSAERTKERTEDTITDKMEDMRADQASDKTELSVEEQSLSVVAEQIIHEETGIRRVPEVLSMENRKIMENQTEKEQTTGLWDDLDFLDRKEETSENTDGLY